MQKIIFVAALVVLCATAQAQVKPSVFGVKAGLEMPSIEAKNIHASIMMSTGFHAGVFARFVIPVLGLGVQPEVLYAYRGEHVFDRHSSKGKGVSFIDLPLNITWGVNLKAVRPFVALTPYISYSLTDVKAWVNANDLSSFQSVDNFDYGVGVGAGVELFQKLQIMGRYTRGMKNLVHDGSYKMRDFSLSVGWLF